LGNSPPSLLLRVAALNFAYLTWILARSVYRLQRTNPRGRALDRKSLPESGFAAVDVAGGLEWTSRLGSARASSSGWARAMIRIHTAAIVFVLALLCAPRASADRELFEMDAFVGGILTVEAGNNSMIALVEDFIEGRGGFGPIGGLLGFQGSLDYMEIPNAVNFDVQGFATQVRMTIPSTGTDVTFMAATPSSLADEIENWFQKDGVDEWMNFLRIANGVSQLALLSGNPKSTVALMGDNAYRKFGYDDSRSRFGFGEKKIQRVGGVRLRIDASASAIDTRTFDGDLASFDGAITLGGEFGRRVGLSLSIIGQYRNYNGAKMGDVGIELALPLTFDRPDTSERFWQLTPFVQVAGGVSIDAVAGGLFIGGGLVNAIGFHRERWDFLISNEIAYYGGIPIDDIKGYDFDTKLSQLFFKNGVEATVWPGAGFYLDIGTHFTNFVLDAAAVPWYVTPTAGIGWQASRWMDIRIAYEVDIDNNDYLAHNAVLKLEFMF
jgi:hypothetical protein